VAVAQDREFGVESAHGDPPVDDGQKRGAASAARRNCGDEHTAQHEQQRCDAERTPRRRADPSGDCVLTTTPSSEPRTPC
jgi:hypothetical protein